MGARRDALVVLGVLLVLGVLGGLLWVGLVHPAEFTKTARGGAMGENDLSKKINADAWFALIGAGLGLVAGLVLGSWRSRDALLTSGLLVVGSLLAAGVMVAVGRLLGPHGTEAALRAASVGDKVPEPLRINTFVVLVGWPFGIALGDVFVLLGRAPETALEPARTPPG